MIFGHQSDSQNGVSDSSQSSGVSAGGSFIVGAPTAQTIQTDQPAAPSADDQTVSQLDAAAVPDDVGLGETELTSPDTVLQQDSQPRPHASGTPVDQTDTSTVSNVPQSDLLALKQQALNDLGPLIDQLDQTPEERFRTTMMMIQSTDNQTLIKDAYAAAQEIQDEKMRAQALLDVVNEINYFTQQAAKA